MTPEYENEKKHLIERYLSRDTKDQGGRTEVLCMTPLCSLAVARTAPIGVLPQHGLLGFHAGCEEDISEDEPILFTVNAPNSTFICGSQGSGKSYTLSAIFDDCLRKDESVNELTDPLAAVVFHYHNDSPTVAEAAYICSLGIKVGVLVSRSSAVTELKQRYLDVPGATNNDFTVNDFVLQDRHLTVKRMLKMMTFDESEWTVSLYMKVIRRTFRETAIKGKQFEFPGLQGRPEAAGICTRPGSYDEYASRFAQEFHVADRRARHRPLQDHSCM